MMRYRREYWVHQPDPLDRFEWGSETREAIRLLPDYGSFAPDPPVHRIEWAREKPTRYDRGSTIAAAWDAICGKQMSDNIFGSDLLFKSLQSPRRLGIITDIK